MADTDHRQEYTGGLGTAATKNTGTTNGTVPIIGAGNVLATSILPALAITSVTVVADLAARLALDAQEGDVAVQTDTSKTYILSNNDPTVDGNWKEIITGIPGAATDYVALLHAGTTTYYSTLSLAKADAVSGDTIVVGPGTYDENDLLKDGVNWHFLPGAVVASTDGTSTVGIFDDGATGANGPVTCSITGHGVFSTVSEYAFHPKNAGSIITFQADSVDSGILIEGGTITLDVRKSTGSIACVIAGGTVTGSIDTIDTSGTVDVEGATTEVYLTCRTIRGTANDALVKTATSGAYFLLRAQRIIGAGTITSTPLILSTGGTLIIHADEIENAAGPVVGGGYSGSIRITGARIRALYNDADLGAAVKMGNGGTSVILDGCTIVAHASATDAISASAPCDLKVYGSLSSNKSKSSDVTILVGTFVSDTNVT